MSIGRNDLFWAMHLAGQHNANCKEGSEVSPKVFLVYNDVDDMYGHDDETAEEFVASVRASVRGFAR